MHYHVLYGLVGCLPDSGTTFDRKRDAEAYARELAREERAAGRRVWGNARHGGYHVAPTTVIEIVPCDDGACEEESW